MCGRFTQRLSSSEFARIFGASDEAGLAGERYNVSPTQTVAAVVQRSDDRVVERFRWGLVPPWAAAPTGGGRLINARAETLASSPAFRHSFRAKRCLIPADGFYEWLRTPAARQPYYITAADGSALAFAGLWSAWRDRAAGRASDGDETPEAPPLLSCTIATTTPNEVMATIHNRMPVILPPDAWNRWLDPTADPGELLALLRPFAGRLVATPVAPLVNSPRNQGPRLIEPLAGAG